MSNVSRGKKESGAVRPMLMILEGGDYADMYVWVVSSYRVGVTEILTIF